MFEKTIYEGANVVIQARVNDTLNANLTQADFDETGTITYKVFDKTSDTPETATESGTFTYTDVIADSLTDDAIWTADSTGRNFTFNCPGTWFPDGGQRYEVEVIFTDDDGNVYPDKWLFITLPLSSN